MKKALLIVCAVVCSIFFASAQKLTSYVEYWDYWQTQIKRKFTVLPNDVQHGTELWYDKTGTLTNTTVYDNGNVRSFKTHFRDGSIDTQGDVVQLPYAEERRSGNTGELLTLDLCRTFKDYHANRSVFIESKLYKQTRVDSLGNNYPFTIIGSDNGNEDAKLLNWRLESYSIKGAHWGSLTFTTSPDKTMEYLKCYSKEGVISADITYDIYEQKLTIHTLTNDTYQLKDGYLIFNKSVCTYDKGAVFEYLPTKIKVGEVKIFMSRYAFYKNIMFAMKDSESGVRFMAVSPNGIYLSTAQMLKFVDTSIMKKKLIGRAFDFEIKHWGYNVGLLQLVEGNESTGKYEYSYKWGDTQDTATATYVNDTYTSFAFHKTGYQVDREYQGQVIETEGKIESIRHPITDDYIDVWTPKIVPHGKGTLIDHYNNTKYEGNFVNGVFEGNGQFICDNGRTIYEGEFKNGEYNGKGVLKEVSKEEDEPTFVKTGIFIKGQFARGVIEATNVGGYKSIKVLARNKIEAHLNNGDYYIGEPTGHIQGCLGPNIGNLLKSSDKTFNGEYKTGKGNIYKGEFLYVDLNNVRYYAFKSMEKRLVKGLIDADTSEGRFVGEINNGKIDGKGKIVLKNGHIYKGQFVNGVLDVYTPAEVSVNMLTGDKYEGEILNGKLHGKGCVKCANGDYYKGEFQFGKFMGTGNVRVTTKKGVYEGAVVSNQCQKVGTIKKIPTYKGVLPVEYVKVGTIQ